MRTLALVKAFVINLMFLLIIFFSTEVLNKPAPPLILEKIMPASIVDEDRVVNRRVSVNQVSVQHNLKSQRTDIISAEKLLKKTERKKKQEQDILNKIIEQQKSEAKKLAKERKKTEKLAKSQERKKAEKLAKSQERKKAEELAKSQERKKAEELARSQEREKAEKLAKSQEREEAEKLAKSQEREKAEELARSQEREKAEELARLQERKKAEELARSQQESVQSTSEILKNELSQHWIRPRGFYGGLSCVIKITLQMGGTVDTVEIVKSSGNIAFDYSAVQAVQNASPLPIPDELFAEFREFNFNFEK